MSATEGIRLIHVDDDPALVDLTATFLEREDESFVVRPETSASDALERLANESVDCVVSDYEMPGMDGLALLEAVRETYPDLPLVLFTGQGNEAIASEAVSAGVTGYMQKGTGTEQYRILANRIRVSVREYSARRDAERANRRFERVLEQSSDAYVAFDAEWRLTYLNRRAEDLFGLDERDARGRVVWDALDEPSGSDFRTRLESAGESDGPASFEEYYAPLDAWLEVHAFPSKAGLSAHVRNVSERKRAQRELDGMRRRYRSVFEGAFDAMIVAGDEGNAVDVNPAACELFGRSRDELLGGSFAWYATEGCDFEAEWRRFRRSDRDRGYFPFVRPDGTERIAEYGATTRIRENRHLAVLRDATDRRDAEAERAGIPGRMTDAFFALDADWQFTYLNGRAEDLLGCTAERVLGSTIWEEYAEAVESKFETEYRRAMETQETVTFEAYYDPHGTWYEVHAYPDDRGLSVFFRDVTDRRALRDELRRERTLLERILETSPVGITLLDRDGWIVRANSRAEAVLGLSESELAARTYDDPAREIVDEEGARIPNADLPFSRVVETGEEIHGYEHGVVRPDGTEAWLTLNAAR